MKDFVMYLYAPVLAIFYLAMFIALALWNLLVAMVALIIVLPARLMPSPIDDKMYKLFDELYYVKIVDDKFETTQYDEA